MAAGPPLGHPWNVNVGNNPNINREPPPPPIGAPIPQAAAGPPPPAAGPAAAPGAQVVIEQQQAPIFGPPLGIGIGGPAFGIPPGIGIGAFPPVFPQHHPIGMMDPFMLGGVPGGGPLAPICAGSFLPGAHSGIGFGIHGGGVPFPPPPPGAIAGVVPPFAPAVPLWAGGGGLAFGNVPAAVGGMGVMPGMMMGGMGMGIGMGGMGAAHQHFRPAPIVHDGNYGFPAQPPQRDVGEIPGGIPPGVMLVESNEHTIFIRILGNVCPWLSPGAALAVEALAAGSSTALNRLIQICNEGIDEDELPNYAITECIELGSGLWEKGQTFRYNDAVSRVLTMKDAGWDNTRNRTGGNSLHLWGHRV
ncbi:rna-metabolising metallo-beta-lactamase [Pyrenophora seminiperda CCB06]|uniref:Rna-metabolising metallo-beta-lactamase n=1 Tax=Pyrenophora seminiperda CCB06 TaxID=1302712 RepID=A0A3M7MH67_9PLEO|nr:rna-metabolising metallo-beta-lactamase [Pyrenophora seminiperda CCB06]